MIKAYFGLRVGSELGGGVRVGTKEGDFRAGQCPHVHIHVHMYAQRYVLDSTQLGSLDCKTAKSPSERLRVVGNLQIS